MFYDPDLVFWPIGGASISGIMWDYTPWPVTIYSSCLAIYTLFLTLVIEQETLPPLLMRISKDLLSISNILHSLDSMG